MYGAILGDIIGSPFEFDRGDKSKNFELFTKGCKFTDDSVMTIAVAEALMEFEEDDGKGDLAELKNKLIKSMKIWGKKYPNAGYGGRFRVWLKSRNSEPYNSLGNGSAMRVSSVGWMYDSLKKTREIARITAEVTHNHPEGIKGAEATASCIFMARRLSTKKEIKEYVENEFEYNLERTLDEIRPAYHHVETCMETVPEAIISFLESDSFEDAIRNAVSLGGDTDTLAAITGSIAEAYYGVPSELKLECRNRVNKEILSVLDKFQGYKLEETDKQNRETLYMEEEDTEELIALKNAIDIYNDREDEDNNDEFYDVLNALARLVYYEKQLIAPAKIYQFSSIEELEVDKLKVGDIITLDNPWNYSLLTLDMQNGEKAQVLFTSLKESHKGPDARMITVYIDQFFEAVLKNDEICGIVINPWGKSFFVSKQMIKAVFQAALPSEKENLIAIDVSDITKVECGCIVSAANNKLSVGGGVNGAIHKAAGPQLIEDCKEVGKCETGEAFITSGYNLKSDYVIHTVGPKYSGKPEDAVLLGRCYWNSLELAKSNDIHSIAFPSISTGNYGYPLEAAAEIALHTVYNWQLVNPDYGIAVLLACSDQEVKRVYEEIWENNRKIWSERIINDENNGVLEDALQFAAIYHKGKVRKGSNKPYILHPVETMQILSSMGADINLMAAGILHDTVEDTDASILDIYENFGADIAALVNGCTEDKRKIWYKRKLAGIDELPKMGVRDKMLVMADKASNLRSMYRDYQEYGEELWERFNVPKKMQSWYYSGILDGLEELQRYEETRSVYWEITGIFKDLFVKYFYDPKKETIYQIGADGEGYILSKSDAQWRPFNGRVLKRAVEISRESAEKIEEQFID